MYRICLIYIMLSVFLGCNPSQSGLGEDPFRAPGIGGRPGKGTGGPGGIDGGPIADGGGWSQGKVVDPDLALVSFLTQGIVFPNLIDLEKSAGDLNKEIRGACTQKALKLSIIEASWSQTMQSYHRLEALPFGPLDPKKNTLPGAIYSLPLQGAEALIQRELKTAESQGDHYKPRRPRPAFLGLDALEYVFFVAMANQDQLGPDSKECSFLQYVSTDLLEKTQNIKKAFQAEELDFLATPDGKTRLKEYIGAVTDALFFADWGMKDRKILAPAGLLQDPYICSVGVDCIKLYLEHPFALDEGKKALRSNLETLKEAFYGNASDSKSYGYIDYLLELEVQNDEVFNLNSGIDEALSAWDQMPSGEEYLNSFNEAQGKIEESQLLNDFLVKLRAVNVWLKTDFLTSLNVELPGGVQGDND